MTLRIPAGSPRLLRRLNSAAVLRTIRADGPISRAELARVTGLSKPTVNGAVELLLESGYLTERVAGFDGSGSAPRAARSPAQLPRRPRPRARHRHRRQQGAGDRRRPHGRGARHRSTPHERTRAADRRQPPRSCRQPDGRGPRHRRGRAEQPAGRGCRYARRRRPVSGRVTLAPQLGGWEGIRLAHRLEPTFPCSVLVDNEVHLSVLGERWRGSAQGIDDALYVQSASASAAAS